MVVFSVFIVDQINVNLFNLEINYLIINLINLFKYSITYLFWLLFSQFIITSINVSNKHTSWCLRIIHLLKSNAHWISVKNHF